MTPADGSFFAPDDAPAAIAPPCGAALVAGGRAIVFFENAEAPPPAQGVLAQDGAALAWRARCWRDEGGLWRGVAAVNAVPAAGAEVRDAAGGRWRFAGSPRLDVAPGPLAEFVRRAGSAAREVIGFVAECLSEGDAAAAEAAQPGEAEARRGFLRGFIAAAAERDGFVEILAAPDTGGVFAQGWSMSLAPGRATLAAPDAGPGGEVEVAAFERNDILAPARGVCLFGKFWDEPQLSALEAVFFEKDGRLMRLDVVRDALTLEGASATAHVAHMLPRLTAPEGTRAALRRVCRPRFPGTDTLSGTDLPIAAALDLVLRAPDGGLLVIGWMLDPRRRVELALIKSTANLYARLDAGWCPLPRPDLNAGFAADPRLGPLLDPGDVMHGFVAHAAAPPEATTDAQIYLELVLDDGSCLFRPITATPMEGAERLPQALAALAGAEPELARIVDDHLAPFLAGVPPRAPRVRQGRERPMPLGGGLAGREIAAIVPFRSFAELQPMLALVAGAPEAQALDFALVAPRARAAEALPALEAAFEIYGLRGALTLAADGDSRTAQLDLGMAATEAETILAWTPAALPRSPGWLARLAAEGAALPEPGVISPALVYEDGSIYFGAGEGGHGATGCGLAGFGADRLSPGAPRRAAAPAAEAALAPRAALAAAGGFTGGLFGDDFAHVDLADRLARSGCAAWCSGEVAFWILEDPATAADRQARLIRRIDAALLARRGRTLRERAR